MFKHGIDLVKSQLELVLDMATSKSDPTILSWEKVQTSLVVIFLLIFNCWSGAVWVIVKISFPNVWSQQADF